MQITLFLQTTCFMSILRITKGFKKEKLYHNTSIIHKENSHQQLLIKECILMLEEKPEVNKQDHNFINIISLYNTNVLNSC